MASSSRLRNAKFYKEDIKHLRLLVCFKKALSGEHVLDLECAKGAAEVTLESLLRNESAACLRHPTIRATFLVNNQAVDTNAKLWDLASDEFTKGRVTTKNMEICIVYTARNIRVVPFVSLGDHRPSVPLRGFAFDVQISASSPSKVLLRDVSGAWLAQVRRDHRETAHLFGLLLEELVVTNGAARKRNLLYGVGLDYFEDCTTETIEQNITLIFDRDHPPRCKLNDAHRIDDDQLSPLLFHELTQHLRGHFGP